MADQLVKGAVQSVVLTGSSVGVVQAVGVDPSGFLVEPVVVGHPSDEGVVPFEAAGPYLAVEAPLEVGSSVEEASSAVEAVQVAVVVAEAYLVRTGLVVGPYLEVVVEASEAVGSFVGALGVEPAVPLVGEAVMKVGSSAEA